MIPVEAIQRVMKKLEARAKDHFDCYQSDRWDPGALFHFGCAESLETVVEELQEVIAQYAPDQTERGISTGDSSEH
jgi:hypothetical protein